MKTYLILYCISMGYSSERFRTLIVERVDDPRTTDGIERLREVCAQDANDKGSPFIEKASGVTICAITEINIGAKP